MGDFTSLFQTANWKSEKHVPVIEAPDKAPKGTLLKVTVTVGKEIAHPNKTEHHIRWIALYFQPAGEKFPYQIGKAELSAHGESAEGPDKSSVYTHHEVTISFKTDKSGTMFALSYCNIHGLWQSSKEIQIQ